MIRTILTLSAMTTWLTAAPILVDDFESGSLSDAWDDTTGASVENGEGAQGSASYATLEGTSGPTGVVLVNDEDGLGLTDFTIDVYVRIQASGRQFNLMVSTQGTVSNDNPTVNLRHQNGWAVFSGGWQSLDLPTMETDVWYRLRMTCNGWGSGGANYEIELSDAGGTEFTTSETGITFYQGGDPNTTPGGAVTFTTFWGSPGFDIDSLAIESIEDVGPDDDPNIVVLAVNPFTGIVNEFNPDKVSGIVAVSNEGAANELTITDATEITGDTPENFSVLTPLPLTIAPGESAELEVQFDALGGFGNFKAELVIASNDVSDPTTQIPLRTFVPGAPGTNVISNGDFELNAESLTLWDTLGTSVPTTGIAPGSARAASIAALSDIRQTVAADSDWYLDFYFQVQDTTARSLNIVLTAPGTELNIRAQATGENVGVWNAFVEGDNWGEPLDGLPGLLPDERYFMRVVGRGWGGQEPNYDVLLSEPGGVALVHRAEGITRFRSGLPTSTIQLVRLTAEFGANPGFIVDDVRFINGTPPPESPFAITGFSHDNASNISTIAWSAFPGTFYDIETSLDLTPDSWQAALTTIEASADASVDTSATVPSEAMQQFMRIVQVAAPPLLKTGFEDGADDWTVALFPNGVETGTMWEFGEPSNGPGAAYAGNNVAGTGLTADYEDGTTILLNSPVLDPTGVSGRLNLTFWYYLGVNDEEGGQVNILEEDGTVIQSFDPFFGGEEGNTAEWTQATFQLPKLDPVRPFRVQFAFLTGNDGAPNNLPGWFIDDVRVGK